MRKCQTTAWVHLPVLWPNHAYFLCVLSKGKMYCSGIRQCTKEREVNVQKPGQNDWLRGWTATFSCISEHACRQKLINFSAGIEIPFLLGVLWYKTLDQQQCLCGNWEKEGVVLASICLRKFLQRKVDPEATNQQLKVENHNLLPPSGASVNIVPCSWDAQEALHTHGCKTKDQLLYFGPANGHPTAKLNCSLRKDRLR